MGIYINPSTMSKEAWLAAMVTDGHAVDVNKTTFKELKFSDLQREKKVALVLIDNGPFRALAVSSPAQELSYHQAMVDQDTRPMKFYVCDLSKAMEFAS